MKKEIYYSDELNDDFAGSNVKAIKIDENYEYVPKNIFWKITSWFIYRVIALPISFVYLKLKFGYRIENRVALKPYIDKGYYMYINHTQNIADVLWPTFKICNKDAWCYTNSR